MGECRARITVPRSNQYKSPMYNELMDHNDIGLLELPTPITFDVFIQPAKMSTACDIPHKGGQEVVAIGIGNSNMFQRDPNSRSQLRLRHGLFVTESSEYCSDEVTRFLSKSYGHFFLSQQNYME